jgi:cobalt-precorrin 5A hydrolase
LQTLETAVDRALKSVALSREMVVKLATIDKKQDEGAIRQLSTLYQWPLFFFPAEELARVIVPSPSAVVMKYMGTPSVAEAAAILAAGADQSALLLEKYKYCGQDGKNATISIVHDWQQ